MSPEDCRAFSSWSGVLLDLERIRRECSDYFAVRTRDFRRRTRPPSMICNSSKSSGRMPTPRSSKRTCENGSSTITRVEPKRRGNGTTVASRLS